jgi:hypothetical protein
MTVSTCAEGRRKMKSRSTSVLSLDFEKDYSQMIHNLLQPSKPILGK